MLHKKGAIEPLTKTLLSITLIIIFFIMAYTLLFTDMGQKTVDAANYYVFSKLGVAINPAKLGKIATEGTVLGARITAQPESPVCAFEPVYFSANSTSLPKGARLQDVNCYWDFDIASEPTGGSCTIDSDCTSDYYCKTQNGICVASSGTCTKDANCPSTYICLKNVCAGGICSADTDCVSNYYCTATKICALKGVGSDGDTTNDYQASTCDAVSNGPWPSSELTVGDTKQGVQLIAVAAGKTDTDVLFVKSTLMCACAGVSPGCSDAPATNPALPATLANHKSIDVSFKESWKPAAVHILIEPVGDLSDLVVGIGPDRGYQLKGAIANPAIIYGQNLLHLIEQQRSRCVQSGTDPCPVTLSFDFSGSGSIIVKEIWIPLG